ncbi:hypothetical protein AAFN85_25490 [Mucilaginibacter sp. CAU 1740]|uniref:hypothetical protein n=1 Tax=Mucilaginibacter sp. CAU 1740 TaxID=3140365 RepID=UPI00325BB3D0
MNRRSVYNWFNQKYLKQEIIHEIGLLISHDFSVEFPELFRKTDFLQVQGGFHADNASDNSNYIWKDKYIELLEKYNTLLRSKVDSERHS